MIKTTTDKSINRKKPPKIIDAVDLHLQLKAYRKFILKNGIEVYAIDAGAEEVMMIDWVFYAGNWFENKNIVAATTNFLLKNGTSKKTAFEINEHFEFYGSHLNRSCYNETASLTLHCLNKHVKELLPVVKELITDSIFPEQELSIYKKNMQQRLAVNLKKNDFVANRLIDAYLFGEDHPYGRYTSHEDFDALQRDQLIDFFKNYYEQGKLILFAAGRLPANLEQLLDEHFGDLPAHQINFQKNPPRPVAEKKYRVVNDPGGVQGAIRIGREFPNRHHPDFARVQVLNNLFGGFFGSRLMHNIREDKGYTYGIYSYLQNHIQYSAWVVSTEAGRGVSEETVKEIYNEMSKLRDELIGEEELSLVRNYMMGTILGDLDGPFQILSRWKNLILNRLDESYFYKSIEIIRTISADELRCLARKYLVPGDFYELVVV